MNQADVTDAVNYGSACLGICLKPEQTQAVHSLLAGEDVFVSLPTGYGKSAIFQVLPFCASYLVSLVNPNPEPSLAVPVVLIVSPLISLVADQVVSLQDKLHVHLPDRRSGSVVSVGTGGNLSTPESLNAFVTHLFGVPNLCWETHNGDLCSLVNLASESLPLLWTRPMLLLNGMVFLLY